MGFASQSLFNDGLALLRKANPFRWNCFASQSQSIVKDRLCFAKPIRHLEFFGRPFLALSIFPGFRMVVVADLTLTLPGLMYPIGYTLEI